MTYIQKQKVLPRRETRQDRRLKKIMYALELDTTVEDGIGLSRKEKRECMKLILGAIEEWHTRLEKHCEKRTIGRTHGD